jgi:hypothetical protein
MKTSDSCYAWPVGIDSVRVERSAVTGIIDPEFPAQTISVAPNPFAHSLYLDGLQPGKLYRLTIRNSLGQAVFQYDLEDAPAATVNGIQLPKGVYWITLYDRQKNRTIGTMAMVSAD